jgi:hypothetical protein
MMPGAAQNHGLERVAVVIAIMIVMMLPQVRAEDQAAPAPGLEQDLEEMMGLMTELLLLTPEQQQAVRPVIRHSLSQRRTILEQADHASLRDKLRRLDHRTDCRLYRILSTVQMEDYHKLRDRYRQHRENQ